MYPRLFLQVPPAPRKRSGKRLSSRRPGAALCPASRCWSSGPGSSRGLLSSPAGALSHQRWNSCGWKASGTKRLQSQHNSTSRGRRDLSLMTQIAFFYNFRELTWYLLVELKGISATLLYLSLSSLTEPQHSSIHFSRAASEASPATSLCGCVANQSLIHPL